MPVRWLCEQVVDDHVAFRLGRDGDDLVADFVGVATLRARKHGAPELTAAPNADPEALAKVQEGAARALVRHLDGKLSIHGGAAARAGSAIACVGMSGVGKSTAIAHLCKRYQAELVADDVAALELGGERVEILPMEVSHWLLPASAEALGFATTRRGKARVNARVNSPTPSNLIGIVELVFDDHPSLPFLRRLRGTEAFRILALSTIRFAVDEPLAHLNELDQLTKLASSLPVWRLQRPRDLSKLDASSRILDAILSGSAPVAS
jgi:hypothetical protein